MARRAVHHVDPEHPLAPYDRQPGEGHKAYAAFKAYCGLGGDRSLPAVAAKFGVSHHNCKIWSHQHKWTDRAAAWDIRMSQVEQEQREKTRQKFIDRWELRRLEAAEANWDRAQRLALKAEKMLQAPLYTETVQATDESGRPVNVTMEPARWDLKTAGALLKLAAELQQAALSEALGGQDDGFDPATATPEECRAYLERKGIKALPAPAVASRGGAE